MTERNELMMKALEYWRETLVENARMRAALTDIALMKMPWQNMPDRAREGLRAGGEKVKDNDRT